MSICVIVNSSGLLEQSVSSMPDCAGYALLELSEWNLYNNPFNAELLGITPENILYVYTWGMGVILAVAAIGYAVGSAKKTVNKA